MNRYVSIATACLLFATAAWAEMPKIGKAAPDFTATDAITGKKISLSDFRGKPVVLEWNNFKCPFVKKFYSPGAMQALQARAAKNGVVWITINSSAEGKDGYIATAQEVKAALASRKAKPAHYLLDHDGTIGHLYGAKSTPTMVVIDKKGTLAYQGAIDNRPSSDPADIAGATNYVTEALSDLDQGRKVKISSTQAYGCFVHY